MTTAGSGTSSDAMVNAPAAAAPGGPGSLSQSELIIIHVCDEARQINRDFACDRSVLLEEMKYFQSYLGGDSGSFDDIDISVHCDVHIFEWSFPFFFWKSASFWRAVARVASSCVVRVGSGRASGRGAAWWRGVVVGVL